jgi:hypothetical protein
MKGTRKKIEKSGTDDDGKQPPAGPNFGCVPMREHEESDGIDRGRRWSTAGTGRRGGASPGSC